LEKNQKIIKSSRRRNINEERKIRILYLLQFF
jgi:hypothetical protein